MELTREPTTCTRCGGTMAKEAPLAQCPECLLRIGQMHEDAGLAEAPERFGRYRLLQQLGRGAMGVVYEATDLELSRRVALKLILDSQVASSGTRRRFKIEAEAAAKLDHPNIVPIYEVGEWEGQPFLSMKLVKGMSLREAMASGHVGFGASGGANGGNGSRGAAERVARLMATIARAMHHAHQHGVLHRDLKPANVIIDSEGQPHLADFGLAKLLDESPGEGGQAPATLSGSVLGTPSYMSPEQAAGRSTSVASDIYGLGAILYELLTGQPPFKGATAIETLRMVAEQEPPRPRVLQRRTPRDLETIALKCLEKNPERRYVSAEALAADLELWLAQRPIKARPAGPILRLRRWTRRNPAVAALIVSLCCGLAMSLVLLRRESLAVNEAELGKGALLFHITQQIEGFWKDTNHAKVTFSAFELAALYNDAGRPMNLTGTLGLRLSFELNDNPIARATAYAPVLRLLEDRMEKLLKRPVRFDLVVYKYNSGADSPAAAGTVDFQRMNVLDYMRAKQSEPRLQLLLQERAHKEAVIFARKDAGIRELADVKGHSVAFVGRTSIISALAVVHLARAGVSATNLGRCQYLDVLPSQAPGGPSQASDPSSGKDSDPDFFAHRALIDAVAAGDFDVGEARRLHFERFRRRGLVELCRYEVSPDVYAARPGLERPIVDAFRESLLSLQAPNEKALLQRLHVTPVEGFDALNDTGADFIKLLQEISEALSAFEPRSL